MSDPAGEQIRQYINDQFLFHKDSGDVPLDASLFGRGMLDSAHMVDIIAFLESAFGIAIPSTDITPENFDTIHRMATYVERAQSLRR
jgi:acyl carrier protein